jgi:O-antigen/teichoic acid export membrane protein
LDKLSIFKNEEFVNTLKTFLSRILVFGIGLLFKIYLARTLSVEENGNFGKWLATYNYGIIALSFGLNLSLIYFVETKRISKTDGFSVNFLFYLFLIPILFGISIVSDDTLFFLSVSSAIVIGLWISTLNSVQLILKRISRFNLTELLRNVFVFISIFIYLNIVNKYELVGLYFGYVIGLLLSFIIFFSLEKELKVIKFDAIKKVDFEYFQYGSKGLVLNILGQALYIFDIYIVDYLVGAKFLGLYVVAGSIARLLWFFVDAAGTIIFPRLIQGRGTEDSKIIVYRLSSISFFFNIMGVILFYFLGEFLIEISFGQDYVPAYDTILILLFASQGMVFYKLVNRYLVSVDQWKISYISVTIAVLVNLALNFALVPSYNILGSAFASLIAYWVCGLLIAKLSGFDIKRLLITTSYK